MCMCLLQPLLGWVSQPWSRNVVPQAQKYFLCWNAKQRCGEQVLAGLPVAVAAPLRRRCCCVACLLLVSSHWTFVWGPWAFSSLHLCTLVVNKFWQAFRSLLLRRCGAAAAVLLVSCLSHRIGPLFGGLGPSPCFTCALLCLCVALGVCPFCCLACLSFPFPSPHHFGTFVLSLGCSFVSRRARSLSFFQELENCIEATLPLGPRAGGVSPPNLNAYLSVSICGIGSPHQ